MNQKRPTINEKIIRYMRQLIFGLEDSLVSTFGAITGVAAGSGDSFVVILTGMVIIFVESLSMGVGAYLSAKSESEVIEEVARKEKELISKDIEGEKEEIRAYLKKHGFKKDEIEPIVERLVKNRKLLFEEMMLHEYKMVSEPRQISINRGFVMWLAYIGGGIFPVVPYLFFPIGQAIYYSLFFTLVVLFAVGAYKTKFTGISWWKSGLEMAALSLLAGGIGFLVGRVVAAGFGV